VVIHRERRDEVIGEAMLNLEEDVVDVFRLAVIGAVP